MKSSSFVIPQRSEIIRYETELSSSSKLVLKLLKALPGVLTFARTASYSCLTDLRCKFSALTLVSSKRKPLHPTWHRGSHSRGAAGEVKQLDNNTGLLQTLMMEKSKRQGVLWKCSCHRLTQSREEPQGC